MSHRTTLAQLLATDDITLSDDVGTQDLFPMRPDQIIPVLQRGAGLVLETTRPVRSLLIFSAKYNLPRHSFATAFMYGQDLDTIEATSENFPEPLGFLTLEFSGDGGDLRISENTLRPGGDAPERAPTSRSSGAGPLAVLLATLASAGAGVAGLTLAIQILESGGGAWGFVASALTPATVWLGSVLAGSAVRQRLPALGGLGGWLSFAFLATLAGLLGVVVIGLPLSAVIDEEIAGLLATLAVYGGIGFNGYRQADPA